MLRASNRLSWIPVFLISLAGSSAHAVEVQVLSRIPARQAPDTGNGASRAAALSANGRFLLFTSTAENLVEGVSDTNNSDDLFLFDSATGETILVSQSSGPEPVTAKGFSLQPSMSADGRFVTFMSTASDLVAGQAGPGGVENVYVWDRINRTTELVSHEPGSRTGSANGSSSLPVISADGRFIAYQSFATNLVDGVVDENFSPDLFVYDRRTGENVLVSRSAASAGRTASWGSSGAAISADGRFIAFRSESTNLVPGQIDADTSGDWDFFLWDRTTGRNVLVSHAAGNPARAANGEGLGFPLLSANGAFVAFGSNGRNLVPRQSGTGQNVFVWQRATGEVTLVTHAPGSPTQGAGDSAFASGIAPDGSWVLYNSTGRKLVPGQKDHPSLSTFDGFLWSRQNGQSRLLSGRGGSASRTGNNHSFAGGFSADGSAIGIASQATDLVAGVTDANHAQDAFLWSRGTGRIALLSHAAGSSSTTAGGLSGGPLVSMDGQSFAYTSGATNLAAGVRDTNGSLDAVWENRPGHREIASLHAAGLASVTPMDSSLAAAVSADGRWAVFVSAAFEFLPRQADRNNGYDVFLHDRATGTITLVSRAAGVPRRTGNGDCFRSWISADGLFVALACTSTNLIDAGAPEPPPAGAPLQLYLWSRETGAMTLVSHAAGAPAVGSADGVTGAAISADGSVVAFLSTSTDLVAGQVDTEDTPDLFAWERATGTVSLLSAKAGSSTIAGGTASNDPVISADGRFATFISLASDLVAGATDSNGLPDVFLRDRAAGTTVLVSRTADGAEAASGVAPQISDDGRFIAFSSWSGRIVPGQADPVPDSFDLFLWDRQTGAARLVSHSVEGPLVAAGGVVADFVDLDAAGRFVAFSSTSPELVSGVSDENGTADLLLFDRESGSTILVSRAQGNPNATADDLSWKPGLSADGRRLVFTSQATNLASAPEDRRQEHLYLYDRTTGVTSLLSHTFEDPARRSFRPVGSYAFAASGSAVLWSSQASDFVPFDFNGLVDAFAAPLP